MLTICSGTLSREEVERKLKKLPDSLLNSGRRYFRGSIDFPTRAFFVVHLRQFKYCNLLAMIRYTLLPFFSFVLLR